MSIEQAAAAVGFAAAKPHTVNCGNNMKLITAIFIATVFVSPAYAGGSVDFSDVRHLLEQKPEFASAVSSLKVEESGFAEVVINFKQPHLGGHRLGPYIFNVKSQSERELELLLCTKPSFKDLNGHTANFFEATEVTEHLKAIILREPGTAVHCPAEDDS
ncbi:MAG: hypothetical protein HYS23_11545 [Geobacter sp.]|nr:hypothetical protein [Geobacter sp.]